MRFRSPGLSGNSRLDKRYLSRDDILYVRNQMAHHCLGFFMNMKKSRAGKKWN